MGALVDLKQEANMTKTSGEWRMKTLTSNQKCGHCHTCGGVLRKVLDGEEWCDVCRAYRRYRSHGWSSYNCTEHDLVCPTRLCPRCGGVLEVERQKIGSRGYHSVRFCPNDPAHYNEVEGGIKRDAHR